MTKTGEGSYTVDGTRAGPNGKVTDVDKTINKTPDGTTSVHLVYTGPEGKTKAVTGTLLDEDAQRSHGKTQSVSWLKKRFGQQSVDRLS